MADDELDLDSEEGQVLDPNIRRELRDGRKHRAQQEAELAAARRDLAFARVGVDDSTPLGKMFVRGYDGDITTEAIRAAAEEIPGLLAPPKPDPNAMSAEEIEAQRRMAGASGGAGVGGPDLRTAWEAEFRAKAAQPGTTIDDLMALVDQADPSLGITRKGLQGSY